jgi:hypothetical protein
MVGTAGLTSTAPAAYYVVTGHLDPLAWSLWAANFLFAKNNRPKSACTFDSA